MEYFLKRNNTRKSKRHGVITEHIQQNQNKMKCVHYKEKYDLYPRSEK